MRRWRARRRISDLATGLRGDSRHSASTRRWRGTCRASSAPWPTRPLQHRRGRASSDGAHDTGRLALVSRLHGLAHVTCRLRIWPRLCFARCRRYSLLRKIAGGRPPGAQSARFHPSATVCEHAQRTPCVSAGGRPRSIYPRDAVVDDAMMRSAGRHMRQHRPEPDHHPVPGPAEGGEVRC